MEIVVIVLLLVVNGVFAMYEIALVSSSRARLETSASKGNKKAVNVLKLLEEPEKILSTIQVGITLIGIVSGAFGGVALADDVKPLFLKVEVLAPYAGDLAMITVVALITYLSLIVGELVPKSLALNNPEKIAMSVTPFMVFLTKLSYPFVWFLSVSTKIVNKLLGIKSDVERHVTEDEIKFLLHQSSEQGVLDKQETEMIKDVFRFSDKRVDELMTHRRDVISIFVDSKKQDVLQIIKNENYSKYLLCGKKTDDVIGVVGVKNMISIWDDSVKFDLKSIACEPLFLPETLQANKVLEIFKKNKTDFGIVVDEYGSVQGIVTLHDLTESILGDIPEEDDEDEMEIVYRHDGSLLVDGAMSLDDFMDEMNILSYEDIDDGRFSTLGGLAMHMLKKVPKTGDKFFYKNLEFEIVDMDNSRVDKMIVTKIDPI